MLIIFFLFAILRIFELVECKAIGVNRGHYQYAIIIDAGSSHSQVTLYKWPQIKIECTGIVERVHSCEVDMGIDDYGNDCPNQMKAAQDILTCVAYDIGKLVEGPRSHISINLAATAGMRLAKIANANSTRIFSVIENLLKSKIKLKVKKVDILSGQREGLFAWVTVNFLTGYLQDTKSNDSIGVLDMGGASAQIAYRIEDQGKGDNNQINVTLYGKNHTVHTYSNLCYGVDQARFRYYIYLLLQSKDQSKEIESPCHPKGSRIAILKDSLNSSPCLQTKSKQVIFSQRANYFLGIGDAEKCAEIIDKHILDEIECNNTYNICFEALDKPPPESTKFIAISSYFHSSNILELSKPYKREEYKGKMSKYCNSNKSSIKIEFKKVQDKYLDRLCFNLNFIYSTLQNIYKFSDKLWSNLEFENKIKGTELGWSMGLIINETTAHCDCTNTSTHSMGIGPLQIDS